MRIYYRTMKSANSPAAAAIKAAGLKLTAELPERSVDVLIWEYQSKVAAHNWAAIPQFDAVSPLVIWVDDYTNFREDPQRNTYLNSAVYVVVPSRAAKRDLIMHTSLTTTQVGVRGLLDMPTNWNLAGDAPFSTELHRWSDSQEPSQVRLKRLHRVGGWGVVESKDPYNLSQELSCFWAAGLPVVAQRGTAAGEAVSDHRAGVVVDDLANEEWQARLDKVTVDEYRPLAQHAVQAGVAIRQGAFIKQALADAAFHGIFHQPPFENYASIYRPADFGLRVMDSDDTAEYVLKNRCSVARLGDGEISLINGEGQVFQDADPKLASRLDEIVKGGSNSRLLVCLSDVFHGLDPLVDSAKDWWTNHLKVYGGYYHDLATHQNTYGNTMVTRPYMDFKDRTHAGTTFAAIRRWWQDRDVLLVEGYYTRSGVGNDLYANAHSVERIICPSKNAWTKYQEIEDLIRQHGEGKLVLVMLGMAATVIAADLADWGQVIDLGHLDPEYEWYQMGATERVPLKGKHTAEMNYDQNIDDLHDPEFNSQIVANISGEEER